MIPKFRAWYVLAEEMINEILMISFVRKEIIGKFSDGSTSVPLKFEDKRNGEDVILMQSTGLFDKNGTEIFEGDILADLDESGDELVYLYVIYKDGKFMAVENEERGYSADLVDCTTYHSVVGNIYENAELLGR